MDNGLSICLFVIEIEISKEERDFPIVGKKKLGDEVDNVRG
jgi:hypothetical protein